MVSKYKEKINPLIKLIATPFKGIDPNILTFLGLIPPLLFLYFITIEEYGWALLSMFGVLFDTLDGAVARMSGKVSKFGGILDSTLDRVADAIYIAGFSIAGLVSYELAIMLIVLSYLISYIRSRAGAENIEVKVGLIERPERLLLVGVALLLNMIWPDVIYLEMNLVSWVFIVLIVLSFISVLQRLVKSYELLK
jgi:phosphatidylglycerophosphate synthase